MNRSGLQLEDCLHFLLSTTQNKVAGAYRAKLAAAGVTPSQAGVISCLTDCDGMTQKQIGERMFLEGATVSGIVDRMEKKGFVTRAVNAENRREIRVWFTKEGRALIGPVREATIALNEAAFCGFSPEEEALFVTLLQRMMTSMA